MEKQLLKSPCYSCSRSDEDKDECAPGCEKLKEYKERLPFSVYEDSRGSVFQIYTLMRA